jgi:hypothetical protein
MNTEQDKKAGKVASQKAKPKEKPVEESKPKKAKKEKPAFVPDLEAGYYPRKKGPRFHGYYFNGFDYLEYHPMIIVRSWDFMLFVELYFRENYHGGDPAGEHCETVEAHNTVNDVLREVGGENGYDVSSEEIGALPFDQKLLIAMKICLEQHQRINGGLALGEIHGCLTHYLPFLRAPERIAEMESREQLALELANYEESEKARQEQAPEQPQEQDSGQSTGTDDEVPF